MAENIQIIGLDDLDSSEIAVIKEIISKYMKKISNKMEYTLLKISFKQHQRIKYFIHEVKAELFTAQHNKLSAMHTDKNIYKATASIMEKILAEIEHLKNTRAKNVKEKKY